jgi:hypothetical protein
MQESQIFRRKQSQEGNAGSKQTLVPVGAFNLLILEATNVLFPVWCHTPKHGSWLNIAENELSCITRQCVNGRRIGSIEFLASEIAAWSSSVNAKQRGVDWQMRIDDARCKLKSVYPKIKT